VFDDPNMGSGAMMRVAAQNRDMVYQERARARNAEAEVQRLRAEVVRLTLALAVKKAHAGGLDAQLDKFIELSPTSPARAPSGKTYQDGRAKSVARISYETVFDRIARDLQISRPTDYRTD
jgi:hypothetical protein